MFEIVDALKNGFNIWKKAKFTQIAAVIVILFIGVFVITPLGFLIAINAAEGQLVWDDATTKYFTSSLVSSITLNPGFWLSSFATLFVGVIISTVLIATIQKIAHDYAEKDTGNFTESLKELGPMLVPLMVVAIVMAIIIGIPAWLGAEIFNIARDPTDAPIWSFAIFGEGYGYVELQAEDIVAIVAMILIFLLLSGPFFLSISAVVVDGAGNSGLIEGWRLYFRKFTSTFVAMFIVFIIGIIIALLMYIPIRGIVTAEDELSRIFLNIFLLMAFGFVISFFINNWLYSSLYSFYQAIK
ncbi:MAG: hypothetical protein ACE5I5_10795 [Candidatus Heimdallarchaeota archaeon]